MTNLEEKSGEDVNSAAELSKATANVERKEREIKRQSAKFESQMRRNFEKHLAGQTKSYESLLRSEMPKSLTRNRQIIMLVVDTGIKLPIYQFHFSVDKDFDSIALGQDIEGRMLDYLNSEQFFEIQKKLYYRLKKRGVEPCEIYPQIEPRYSAMDSRSKKILRNNLTKWYSRQITKNRGDKKPNVSPRSKRR